MADFQGKIFAIWKPKGITSNKAIQMVKGFIGIKKVGHAGTLDPLAEGILVIGAGRDATKKLSSEVAKEKEYMATIKFGEYSTTDDEEGEKTIIYDGLPVELNRIREIIPEFAGHIDQVPPVYSAVKIAGKEAYKYARKGKEVEMKSRTIEIRSIEIVEYNWPFLKLRVVTGPGAYIRSLARDIGQKLGTGAYLAGLIRTRVGEFDSNNALSLDELRQL